MATRDEKDALEILKKDLVTLSEDIVKQANAVTDRVTSVRLHRLAGEALRLGIRVSDLLG